jgi:IS5 family transposase
MRFLGLDFAGRVPDAKTVWLFRDLLQKKGLVRTLFDEMNAQLEVRGIIAHNGQIVDASFVEAPRQRNSRAENETIKAGEVPEAWTKHSAKLCQKDVEARWAMKGGETHYGYKNHVLCDRRSKLVLDYQITDAAVHESTVVESLVETGFADGESLYGDSAYRSAGIEETLAERGIRSRIHQKGYRDHPLSARQQKSNRARSRVRARVEHVFAFMTDSMGGMMVRACSKKRNETVIGLINLTYNLCRLVQLKKTLHPIHV